MREVGSPSWRFTHDIDQTLHFVLYLRDALGLSIEGDQNLPPGLVGEVPCHSDLLDALVAGEAAERWLAWWRAVVVLQAPSQLLTRPETTDLRAWARQLGARHQLVFDPPGWASLADSPALQSAARDLWVEGYRWFESARAPYLPPDCRDVFAWERVRDSAERAAIEHGVQPGEVGGCVQVLLVEGSWWRLEGPGDALCSLAAARDSDIIPIVLTSVFGSYLTA